MSERDELLRAADNAMACGHPRISVNPEALMRVLAQPPLVESGLRWCVTHGATPEEDGENFCLGYSAAYGVPLPIDTPDCVLVPLVFREVPS